MADRLDPSAEVANEVSDDPRPVLQRSRFANEDPHNSDRSASDHPADSGAVAGQPRPVVQQLELRWDVPIAAKKPDKALEIPPVAGTKSSVRRIYAQPATQRLGTETAKGSKQTERIRDLEQAVDQCQVYIQELKSQLADQGFLEAQLAATEETAQIQQQAIGTLKAKLAEQENLATELAAVLEHNQVLQTNLSENETQTHTQEGEIQTLRDQLNQNQQHLSDRQHLIQDLEARLQRTRSALSDQQEIIAALQKTQSPDGEKNKVIQGLSKNLLSLQNKFEALETEYSSQLMLQAKLQHSCQELESHASVYQERIHQLEQQVAEMQEQILQQARQASEYEAAVQHWKDHCLFAEQSVSQLKAVLEQILTDRNLLELVNAAEAYEQDQAAPGTLETEDSTSARFLKHLKIDLPSFLHLKWPQRS